MYANGGIAYHSSDVTLRIIHRSQQLVVALWIASLLGAAAVVIGAYNTDRSINNNPATAVAVITGVSPTRTTGRFIDEAGRSQSPPGGLLYPKGLRVGQRVRVVYDKDYPWRAKISGRSWLQTLPVAATATSITTIGTILTFFLLQRWKRRRQHPHRTT
ncbi:DUF3592 domain-containing protein [Corynebacterium choanae]